MRLAAAAIVSLFVGLPGVGWAQNCCAPAVPQQGVLGETTTLPHTLEIGLHYELLRSHEMFAGSEKIDDPVDTRTDWSRATLTAGYGLLPRLSFSLIVPYTWKKKAKDIPAKSMRLENTTEGIGDISCLVRLSPLGRNFVTYRELSLGVGVKFPTGPVDRQNFGYVLDEELQPGTGSWDYLGSFSFYQGFEPVDFVASATYILTTAYEHDEFGSPDSYEFGNQFSYLLTSNFHLNDRLDLSAALSGSVRGKDRQNGEVVSSTGRHQLWLMPGLQVQVVPQVVRLQAFFEKPVYQHFNGSQLGSDYNIRVTAVYTLPLKKSEGDDG